MATNHTENYQLNLWEPQDSFLREEFNENFRKLDEAARPWYVVGTVEVQGSDYIDVDLGFTPSAVIIGGKFGLYSNSDRYIRETYLSQGFAVQDYPTHEMGLEHEAFGPTVQIIEGGFRLSPYLKSAANPYRYIAFR